MMSVRANRALWNGCHAIIKRIIKIRFYLKTQKANGDTNTRTKKDVTDEEKDEFYN